jgi:hypothetical protein
MGRIRQPLLLLEADHPVSQMRGSRAQLDEYFKKKKEQLQGRPPGSYNIVLESPGISHPSFSDVPLLFAGQRGFPETNVVLHNHELIELKCSSGHLPDKNLKQNTTRLLLLKGRMRLFPTRPCHVTVIDLVKAGQSWRRARMGSTRAARLAGSQQAITATHRRMAGAIVKVTGSVGVTP